ncbi:MAG: type I polyketide synthase [Nostoc sp.]|uniref:type I polyketide synthase n=1 Tax=Nostoc sp. TaxID=1180 RepID=UPI002FF4882B
MNSEQEKTISPIKRALRAIEDLQAKVNQLEYAKREPIAIIGMGCRFPGAENPEAFWQLLRNGVDAITEVPADRWDLEKLYDPDPDAPGKVCTTKGGFLTQVDGFNPEFFGISAREAASIDPQQRLLLEVGWEALENATLAPEHIYNSLTGVFIGIYLNDYSKVMSAMGDSTQIDAFSAIGNSLSVAAGRLSYILGLKGPSMAIDTSCSSSLVSVHLACQSLRLGECNLALAGGVGLNLVPDTSIALSKSHMLNPNGRCQTFDAAANGFVKGEGCGVVVLKRLKDALADGDNILALVRGSAVNHNGRSSSLIAPNGMSQQATIRQALENSGVDSAQIDYVEVQGTGTSVGEPIEVAALGAVFGKNRSEAKPLVIGSVKTNIGHLEPASGIASLIKVVLALQHGEIPPHLHFQQPNPHIKWDELSLKVPTERMPWSVGGKRRLAGVNTFGFSGTNAHVIVEEAPISEAAPRLIERPLHLLALSAKTDEALIELAEKYEKHLAANPDLALGDICFSANNGRSHFQHRLSVVASSSSELYEKLAAFSAGQEVAGLFKGKVAGSPKIAFIFTNFSSQNLGMGRKLYETQPTFRAALDHCDQILRTYIEQPLLEILASASAPALFSLEYALFQLWKSWGIQPTTVMGNNIGKYVAACVAGVFSLEDGLKLVVKSQEDDFQQIAREVTYSQPKIPVVSQLSGEIATPEYWCQQIREPLNAASVNILTQQGYEIFVEIGSDRLSKNEKVSLLSLQPEKEDWQQLLETLGTLYIHGAKVDWLAFDLDYSRQRLQLPTYPWQRKRHWFGANRNGQGKVESLSPNQTINQPDFKQLVKQLEMTAELSQAELNLLPRLFELLEKQHQQSEIEEETNITLQQLNLQSLTAEDIQAWLVSQIAQELGVKPDEINVRIPFDSYGLDSVLAIGIASAGKQYLGLNMSPLLLVHYPTIESLSQHLAKEVEDSESETFEI